MPELKKADPQRLRMALSLVGNKNSMSEAPQALKFIIWEVMKLQSEVKSIRGKMDKKMHKVTKRMEVARKDVKKGKKAQASKVLKKAIKSNEKLVKIDREVRDPEIHAAEKLCKVMKKGKK